MSSCTGKSPPNDEIFTIIPRFLESGGGEERRERNERREEEMKGRSEERGGRERGEGRCVER